MLRRRPGPTSLGSARHLELRGQEGDILSGYGWIFPLGSDAGGVNIGVGTLATAKRPAQVAIKPLMGFYADERREEFELGDGSGCRPRRCSRWGDGHVAGPNWALIGDAAGCVNPLNGEGIDYGMETGRMVAGLIAEQPGSDLSVVWPAVLKEHYGESFSIARRLAGLVTVPRLLPGLGPVDEVGPADHLGPPVDGQPGHRRGPRPGGAGVALGGTTIRRPGRPAAVLLSRWR